MRTRKLVFNGDSALKGAPVPDRETAKSLFSDFWLLVDSLEKLEFAKGPLIHGDKLVNGAALKIVCASGTQDYSFYDWNEDIKREDNILSSVATAWMYRNCEPDDDTNQITNEFIYEIVTQNGAKIHNSYCGTALEIDALLISLSTDAIWKTGILQIEKSDINNLVIKHSIPHAANLEDLKQAFPISQDILILTEDTKSSVYYLKSACTSQFGLNLKRVTIDGLGMQTLKIVDEAINRLASNNKKYHQIFCVFDHDDEQHFDEALDKANALTYKNSDGNPLIVVIPSNPCYEFWLLLHFPHHASSSPVAKLPDASVGDQMRHRLEKAMPSYGKNTPNIWQELIDNNARWEIATQKAYQINKLANFDYRHRPTTAFPVLFLALKQFSLRC